MSTVAGHIQGVRRVLLGASRPEFNKLASELTADATVVGLIHPTRSIAQASYLQIGDELMYVWSSAAGTATVERGMLGTEAVEHAADTLIEVNPRFPHQVIRDESVAEIASWPRSVYRAVGVTATVASGATAIEVDVPGLIDVLRVYELPGSALSDRAPERGFSIKRNMPDESFATGVAIYLDRTRSAVGTGDVQIVCSTEFDTSNMRDSTDLVDDVGLNTGLEDALKYGVCWRMLVGREVKRTFTEAQGEPRHAEEVPPGHQNSLAVAFEKVRDKRLTEEAQRLYGIYGWRGH